MLYCSDMNRYPSSNLILVVAAALAAGCVDNMDDVNTSSVEEHGFLNGFLNGLYHPEGLSALLSTECPILGERLLVSGGLDQPFPAAFATEIAKTECQKFFYYTAELMLPYGESITLFAGSDRVGTFSGAMNMQYLVAQAYSTYTFVQHAFKPAYPIARKIVTQGYAALTNQYTREVSFKTGIAAMDAHRAAGEDLWPREFTQIVPFTPQGIAAMASDSTFLAQQPDFFNPCNSSYTNYNYLRQNVPSGSSCPVPVVVHGNVDYVTDIIPGRSCRILQPGETVPPEHTLVGDVIVPTGGCPLIYYAGREAGVTIYDDRTHNPSSTTDGCDVTGPSALTNCTFNMVGSTGTAIPSERLSYYVFNVKPVAQ